MDAKEFVEHSGILGMKWGKHKNNSTTNPALPPKPSSEDHNKSRLLRKTKRLDEMTNEEIQTFARRMALEKQYKELTKPELSRGRKIFDSVVKSATKGASDMALSYVNKQSAKAVEKLIQKATAKAAKKIV